MTEPSALEWVARLRAGELSARELAEHYLDRMWSADERVHAVLACDRERVLADADAADRRLAAGGVDDDPPPLLGLPVTVKDSIEVAGLRCTGGSVARRDHVPTEDATVVRRLRTAGALVLAKTNLPELSCSYETDNAVHGRTDHPLDPARTPGGSSGGEAALLGADASPLGLGTDGGGSIRLPAHYCGLVGLRPTAGRVPGTGIWPPTRASGLMDIMTAGPMGRTVADVAALAAVIGGPDDVDFYARPVPFGDPDRVRVDGLRIGWHRGTGPVPVSPGTRDAVERVARVLADAGAEVTEVDPPPWAADATELFFAASGADGGAAMRAQVAGAGGAHHPQFVALLESFPERPPSAAEWFELQERIFEFRSRVRRWVAGYDAVVTPVCTGPAPEHGRPPYGVDPADYLRYLAHNDTHVYSVAGLPALSVPAGSEHGLPIGVQVAAPAWREDLALAVGSVIEAVEPSSK
ncbi:amidase [Pseudonocardia acaciae]|uniref:amidase n=1 Tax=Pseudonocardia acaciae TaxID=551276 RepID=UPI00068786D8|nr:amidase [Pseudonocardia acaciae]